MAKKREKLLMVCVGDRVSTKDTPIQGWVEVLPDGTLMRDERGEEEVRFWAKPLARHAGAGSVYEIHVDRDGDGGLSAVFGDEQRPRFVKTWENRDDVLSWRAQHSQAHDAIEAVRAEKRARQDDPIAEEVERLREIVHRQTSYRKRAALISAIASELHRPPRR